MNCGLCKQPIFEDQRTVGVTHYACEVQLTDSWRADVERLTKQRDELLAALRKVPLFGLTDDALGWRCAGCGSVSGINPDGSNRDEECAPDCYVTVVEAAIDKATPQDRRMPPCLCGHSWAVHVIPGGTDNLDIYPHERHCVEDYCRCRNYFAGASKSAARKERATRLQA